jgi:hypothetical protein
MSEPFSGEGGLKKGQLKNFQKKSIFGQNTTIQSCNETVQLTFRCTNRSSGEKKILKMKIFPISGCIFVQQKNCNATGQVKSESPAREMYTLIFFLILKVSYVFSQQTSVNCGEAT